MDINYVKKKVSTPIKTNVETHQSGHQQGHHYHQQRDEPITKKKNQPPSVMTVWTLRHQHQLYEYNTNHPPHQQYKLYIYINHTTSEVPFEALQLWSTDENRKF